MALTTSQTDAILQAVRTLYPNWEGFADPRFEQEEIAYKQATIGKARELLSEAELRRLVEAGEDDEFLSRLELIGKDNNLLWLQMPSSGDLNILYEPQLDKLKLCQNVVDLLYGLGPSHERLGRFVEYLESHGLRSRWTFPTYFLLVCQPDSEMFVKPTPIQDFLELVGSPIQYTSRPNAATYEAVLELVQEVREAFQAFGPRDNVDIQSLIWVCHEFRRRIPRSLVSTKKRQEFEELFQEFLLAYPETEQGRQHAELYSSVREQGQKNFETILAASQQGQDVTGHVLLKLLPYVDNSSNRAKGAWTHWAPAINGDIRRWYQSAGWTREEDWPRIATAILDFVRCCIEDPDELATAAAEFSALPYTTGFQTGILTPILNALRPDDFALINNKPRQVINYLTGNAFAQTLTDYAVTNQSALQLVAELSGIMKQPGAPKIRDADLFDMFCHWLVAVKKWSFREIQYWKIAPGEGAWQWQECLEGEFIAVGWDELGDISGLSKKQFRERCEKFAGKPGWTKTGLEQVWKFAHQIAEGDRIVANRGTTKVLGIGTVSGPYYFVPGVPQGHRLPMEWDDAGPRTLEEAGWRKTLIKLDRERFEAIVQLPLDEDRSLAEPFSRIFSSWEEADWAFEFFRDAVGRLGATGPEDERFAFTMPVSKKGAVLRLNFCGWLVLDFGTPGQDVPLQMNIALLAESAPVGEHISSSSAFKQDEGTPEARVYTMPANVTMLAGPGFRQTYEQSFDYISGRFSHWKRSMWRFAHHQQLFEAVFDQEKRQKLFLNGLGEDGGDGPHPESPFASRAFELLAGLHEDPTTDFYSTFKDEFRSEVIKPFQWLLAEVAKRLSPPVLEVMETERQLFSRIPKNDFGRGGAWPFYWGAFYPRGGKRTEDAQLSLWMNYEQLEVGFHIGDYGTAQRQRFQRNCREHSAALKTLIGDTLPDQGILFGGRDTYILGPDGRVNTQVDATWVDFLRNPVEFEYDVTLVLPRQEVLQIPATDLVDRVAQTYSQLFPLVLLAVEEDPLPAIAKYVGLDGNGPPPPTPEYPLKQFADDTGFAEEAIVRWVKAIERKKQAILYGPPGTGKTYVAERMARHLIGGGDGFWDLVQFHPAYAYEDFIQGIRPQSTEGDVLSYPLLPGRFLEFCLKAQQRQGTCVLIIDEINRANLARVFGELMYLLEYRERAIPLAGGRTLQIPPNVRIIGTMNTADRSIALVDHALRRRFAFLVLHPDYEVLAHYHERHATGFEVAGLIATLKRLNNAIADHHYAVGITFFLRPDLADQVEDIWRMEIEPYLEEYFFDQPDKATSFGWDKVWQEILP